MEMVSFLMHVELPQPLDPARWNTTGSSSESFVRTGSSSESFVPTGSSSDEPLLGRTGTRTNTCTDEHVQKNTYGSTLTVEPINLMVEPINFNEHVCRRRRTDERVRTNTYGRMRSRTNAYADEHVRTNPYGRTRTRTNAYGRTRTRTNT